MGTGAGGESLVALSECAQPEDPVDRVDACQHPPADQVAQGLGRAAAESAVAGAAVEARHWELVGETVPAMDLDRFAGDPEGHFVTVSLGDRGQERVRERVGAGAGPVEHAAADLDILVHLGDFPAHPLKLADSAPERLALLDIAHRLLQGALGETERDARVQTALRVEGREQLSEPVVPYHQIFRRQFAFFEPDLVQVLSAHRVELAGDREAGGALFDEDTADAGAARLPVDAGEDDEHPGLFSPADQRLDAVEPQRVADMVDIGLIVGDVGARVGFRHADRQQAIAAAYSWQNALPDRLGGVGRDDPRLHPDLAEHGHRRHIADLGDLLEHECGIEYREPETPIRLRYGHTEDPQTRKCLHVLPRKAAVHVFERARPKFALRQIANGLHKAALLVG